MAIYVALLRGINVGGKNKIKMAELKRVFEEIGLARVQTYIQSGNVLFESDAGEAELTERCEKAIDEAFGIPVKVVLRTAEELKSIHEGCPFSHEEIAAAEALGDWECLYVSLLTEKPTPEAIAKLAAAYPEGEDRYAIEGRTLYALYSRSVRDSKLAARIEKLGSPITTRNWKTLTKLTELAAAMEG